jgi:hypothetical protein
MKFHDDEWTVLSEQVQLVAQQFLLGSFDVRHEDELGEIVRINQLS